MKRKKVLKKSIIYETKNNINCSTFLIDNYGIWNETYFFYKIVYDYFFHLKHSNN